MRAGYVSAGVTYGYPNGNHAWFRSLVLCPACAKALSVIEVVKLLDNPALCSGLLIDEQNEICVAGVVSSGGKVTMALEHLHGAATS
jgi:hypothetical protein